MLLQDLPVWPVVEKGGLVGVLLAAVVVLWRDRQQQAAALQELLLLQRDMVGALEAVADALDEVRPSRN